MFRTCRKIVRKRTKSSVGVLSVTNVRVASNIEPLLIDMQPSVHGKSKCVKYNRDIYYLFNQQRLDRMSLQAFSEYLNNIPQSSGDGLSELRSKVSDSDLLSFVKSRYIQSRSELLAWSQYITANYAQSQQDIKDYLAQLEADKNTDEPQKID